MTSRQPEPQTSWQLSRESRAWAVPAPWLGIGLDERRPPVIEPAALAHERARIARDMHDDLGASLARIALLSQMTRQRLQAQQPVGAQVDEMSDLAGQLVETVGEIVWALNPKFDSLENLVAYLREYSAGLFAAGATACELAFPGEVADRPLGSEFRRHIFLVLKEALNNVQKHAQASMVKIALRVDEDWFELVVADNGRGLNAQPPPRFRNGLNNMQQRTRALGGVLALESRPGHGTSVRVLAPLPTAA